MGKKRKKERDGLVHFDTDKLDRHLARVGLTKTSLADLSDVSRSTVLKAFQGRGIFPKNAVGIAKGLGFEDVNDLLPSNGDEEPETDVGEEPIKGEWKLTKYLGPWVTASNGLQFRVCRMQHRFVAKREGRGKWYDLLHLASREREALRTHLLRHPNVCERIGPHPHVADNVGALPGRKDDSFWVVDRWVEGATLAEQLGEPFPRDRLPRLMYEIALGLEALHKANVVFRELAPSRVITTAEDGRVVLTDFELAKLLDTGPTVSDTWPDDPYRAPEVEDGGASQQSDLYSWARVLLHAASGEELPPKGADFDAVTRVSLPKAVWRIATDCLAPGPSQRPKNVQQVLRAIRGWARQ
jgi:serine/threonine protein kinase